MKHYMANYMAIGAGLLLVLAGFAFIPAQIYTASPYNEQSFGIITPFWNKSWGEANPDQAEAVVADSSGIYVAGTLDIMSPVPSRIFLLKYDFNGNLKWGKPWTDGKNVTAKSIAVSGGFVYVAGSEMVSTTDWDVVLLKYDTDGHELWNKTWGELNVIETANSMAINGGSIYVTGCIYKISEFGILLAKFDMDGNNVKSAMWGTADYETGNAIAVDSDGVFVCGYNRVASNENITIAKFDTDLVEKWNVSWGGALSEQGHGIATDSSYVYACGDTESYTKGSTDVVVLKYDKTGAYQWNSTWGTTWTENGYEVCVFNSNIYIAGETYTSSVDALLLKLGLDGKEAWNKTWGGYYYESFFAMDIDSSGIYLVGATDPTNSNTDALVLKMSIEGTNVPEISLYLLATFILASTFIVVRAVRKKTGAFFKVQEGNKI